MQRLVWSSEPEVKEVKSEIITSPPLTVEQLDNHIYFYADVDTDRTLDLIRKLYQVDNQLRNERRSRWLTDNHEVVPIWLHIQSPGGGLFSGFSVADQLAAIETPVYSIIEGYCASAATLISIACKKRFIMPNAFMLIHQLSSAMWGKYEEFKDEMNLLNMAMDNIIAFYVKHTKMNESEVSELLKRDSWFSASQCVENGLVDEVVVRG